MALLVAYAMFIIDHESLNSRYDSIRDSENGYSDSQFES